MKKMPTKITPENEKDIKTSITTVIPYKQFVQCADAVVTSVVSDTEGYLPQMEDLAIWTMILKNWGVGFENIKAEETVEMLYTSGIKEEFLKSSPQVVEFIKACEKGIEQRKSRSPLSEIITLAKGALMQVAKRDPEFAKNAVALIGEFAANMKASGGDNE